MTLLTTYQKLGEKLNYLKDWPLLIIRLVLAYGFYGPAITKWKDISSVSDWLDSIGVPLPTLSSYLVAGTELSGVILLTLGLAVRIITVPLMVVMIMAIVMVHWDNGFEAGENGFEIPLYYLVMLFTLFVYGAGKISLDGLLERKK